MLYWFIMMTIQGSTGKVEKLRFDDGRVEFRFMYWARKKGQDNAKWRWGQFNLCLQLDHLNKLFQCMQKKGWIKLQ